MNPVQEEISALARKVAGSTVQLKGRGPGGGSGIIWGEKLIVTNAHVARENRLHIVTTDGRQMQGEVAKRDTRRDLAILRTDRALPEAAIIGDSAQLRTGELVMAVGHPLGVVNAASVGIVQSAPDRRWIRADIKLAPGNSGGPLVDSQGRVIGVNSMIVDGLGMAVPSNTVRRFLEGRTGRIGVTLQPVAVAVESKRRLGLLILQTEQSSPAERAGLITGDVLIAVEGREISEPDDLADALESGAISVEWLRGGRWMRGVVQPETPERRAAA